MARNTIILKRYVDIYNEYKADEAITPGMLCEVTPTGVKKHATTSVQAPADFAIENFLAGKTVTDDWASGSWVKVGTFIPGEVLRAQVTGVTTIGMRLMPGAAGVLIPWAATEGVAIAIAKEVQANVTGLIEVQII